MACPSRESRFLSLPRGLWLEVKLSCERRLGRAAGPDRERARLDDPLPYRVPDGKLGLRDLEGDRFSFLGAEMNAGKAGEGAVWGLDAGDVFAKVELGYLVSVPVARICDVYCYLYRFVAAGRGRLHGKVVVAEGGVAETKAEREERLAIVVDIFMDTRRVAVVEVRKLADAAREGDGEVDLRDCCRQRVFRR